MADIRDVSDILGYLRFGRSTAEKEALAASRSLPDAPEDNTADQDVANRYAAGYLFAQRYPKIAQQILPYVTQIKIAAGSDPVLQSWAHTGMNRALRDMLKE